MVLIQLYTVARLGNRQRSLVVGAITAIGVVVAIMLIDGLPGADRRRAPRRARVCSAGARGHDPLAPGACAAARERAEREAARARAGRTSAGRPSERLLIAQELHDTLAHSLVAINVSSSVALDLGDSQDPAAALEDIKQVSATALRDLRTTLSLLSERGDTAPTTPSFDLRRAPGTVNHARAAGLHAEHRPSTSMVPPVPSAVGAAAFGSSKRP